MKGGVCKKKGACFVLCFFFFLSFSLHVGELIRDRVSQGVTIPVLSNVDIDYSSTTIKKRGRLMPEE